MVTTHSSYVARFVCLLTLTARSDVSPTDLPMPALPPTLAPALVPQIPIALFMENVDSINGRTGSWRADLLINYQFNAAQFPVEPVMEIVNGQASAINELRHRADANNVTVVTERLFMNLYFEGDYHLFPFDTQHLKIDVCAKGFSVNGAILVRHPTLPNGIRPINPATGRHFKAAQFRVDDWKMIIESHRTAGVPYEKSRAQLSISVHRWTPYYMLTCLVLPGLAMCFAKAAFQLPISPIMPRVMISFISFLAIFVHLKQMMSLVPPGAWCWLFTYLIFFITLLGVIILTNIFNSVLFGICPKAAERHDAFLRWMLPVEFVVGTAILYFGRQYHIWLGFGLVIPAIAIGHVVYAFVVKREARSITEAYDELLSDTELYAGDADVL